MLGKIHIFDPHAHPLEPPHAAAIEQFGHHLRQAHHGIQHLQGFGFGQDRGEACGLPRAHRIHRLNLLVEDFFIEKEQSTQGLILRRRRDMTVHSQVGQKRFDFHPPHRGGMALLMKQHKPLGPIDVGLFRPDSIMLCTQDVAHLLEQLLGAWCLWHTRVNLRALYTYGWCAYTARIRLA